MWEESGFSSLRKGRGGEGGVMREGVFLPDKHDVFLGVYLLNQYLETDCFPSMFPIMVQRSMRFEKVFENAIDPGAVADILEMWQELAYYEENTRDFLFPEPRLTPSHPGMCREVLMKTVEGFPDMRINDTRRRFFQDQPAQLNLGYTFKIPGESKPPFVVRHVDSAKPFGENSSQHHSQKSRRKPNFSNFPFPVRRVSSLDSLGANVKELTLTEIGVLD
ncbi:hypothetical protein E5288_WYG003878 [Bos mutus]|uniref:Spermatogenesis-associated protein 6 N-terminal domain-containing protein n=1 Tax=Bos mutus TaxID=72004 RepID=A0A6B0RWR2_9CETA|nr:hypothetical protein [Bos mutus]